MRKFIGEQIKLGGVDISKIVLDSKSRDEIPQILRALQYIYCNDQLRSKVFALLEKHIKSNRFGRQGMDLWKILVMGVLRLNCDWDFDRLKEMVDKHITIREMLGDSNCIDLTQYPLQTIKDNVSLLTQELLMEINELVVNAGHNLVKKKDEELRAKCDSFVVETNVHYPTDINLLFDATRKSVELTSSLAQECKIRGWRQSDSLVNKLRIQQRYCEKIKRSTSQDPDKQAKKINAIKESHRKYVQQAKNLIERVIQTIEIPAIKSSLANLAFIMEIEGYVADAIHQIDLVERRVLKGERIPHGDKIFSIFEKETEWISKGKSGVPQELGIRVGIVEDNYGFILTHMIMEKSVDSVVAEEIISDAKKHFPELVSCSTDKGFWSKDIIEKLTKVLPTPAIAKKGKLSKADRERENSNEFKKARKKHQAVESAINALENHGLDVCPDHGINAFKRYCALGVLARNIQIFGVQLQRQEEAKKKHSQAVKAGIARKKVLLKIA